MGNISSFNASGVALNKHAVSSITKYNSNQIVNASSNKENQYFKERIEELKELRDRVQESEFRFYQMLNLKNAGDGKAAIEELQRRIDSIDKDNNLINLVNNNKYAILAKLSDYFLTVGSNTVIEKVNEYFNSQEVATDIPEEDVISVIIHQFNESLKEINGNRSQFFIKGKSSSSKNEKGLCKYLEGKIIMSVDGKQHFSVELKDDNSLPKEMKEKLLKIINNVNVNTKEKNIENLRYDLQKIIERTVSSSAKKYLDYRFNNLYYKYGLNLNENTVNGFLGELRNDIILDMLMGQPGAAIPTGTIKTLIEGNSINIDSVLQGFGFQVKNYTINKNGEVEFSKSMKASNFIVDRAKAPLQNVLLKLFGTYQFNQPADNADSSYYKIYENLEKALENSNEYFKGYIDNIIKISDTFSARNNSFGLFTNDQLYFNSFFMIKNKLVPSSAIINAIILSLQEAENNPNIMSFNFISMYPSDNNITWENNRNSLSSVHYSFNELANLVTVNYEIKISLVEILEKAYNYI